MRHVMTACDLDGPPIRYDVIALDLLAFVGTPCCGLADNLEHRHCLASIAL